MNLVESDATLYQVAAGASLCFQVAPESFDTQIPDLPLAVLLLITATSLVPVESDATLLQAAAGAPDVPVLCFQVAPESFDTQIPVVPLPVLLITATSLVPVESDATLIQLASGAPEVPRLFIQLLIFIQLSKIKKYAKIKIHFFLKKYIRKYNDLNSLSCFGIYNNFRKIVKNRI
jgi:hypothetical protein